MRSENGNEPKDPGRGSTKRLLKLMAGALGVYIIAGFFNPTLFLFINPMNFLYIHAMNQQNSRFDHYYDEGWPRPASVNQSKLFVSFFEQNYIRDRDNLNNRLNFIGSHRDGINPEMSGSVLIDKLSQDGFTCVNGAKILVDTELPDWPKARRHFVWIHHDIPDHYYTCYKFSNEYQTLFLLDSDLYPSGRLTTKTVAIIVDINSETTPVFGISSTEHQYGIDLPLLDSITAAESIEFQLQAFINQWNAHGGLTNLD